MKRITKELHVFDFDGTLFRNPMPNPRFYSGKELGRLKGEGGWFHLPMSLDPPAVADIPSEDMWIHPIVETAKKMLQRDDCFVVLMTGRSVSYTERVKQLTTDAGMSFEKYFLKPPGKSTFPWKVSEIHALVNDHTPKEVFIYEDRAPHAERFRKFLSDDNISGTVIEIDKKEFPDYYLPREVENVVVAAMRKALGVTPGTYPKGGGKGGSKGAGKGKKGKERDNIPKDVQVAIMKLITDFEESDKVETNLIDLTNRERAFVHDLAEKKSLLHKTTSRDGATGSVSLSRRGAVDSLVTKVKELTLE